LQRRAFLRVLAAALAAGATLRGKSSDAQAARALYEAPAFGNVSLIHITDVHAQLLPIHFREPSVNIGDGHPPHLVGEALLAHYGLRVGSAQAHAFTHLDFVAAAQRYGRMGGYAHLATLIKQLRAARPHALVLDGGDSWQGSATALWTQGADMIGAQRLLGIDYMTAHWEFTYGTKRVLEGIKELGPIQFLAQNVRTVDFEDPVFTPYALREGIAIIGQAFPYTPIAHPRHYVPEWSFGIQEARLQKLVDETRAKGAKAVVLLSHNGMDVDLKLASSTSTSARAACATIVIDCCRYSRICCPRTPRWPLTSRKRVHRMPPSLPSRSPPPRDCSTGAATSTARWTSSSCARCSHKRTPRSPSHPASAGVRRSCPAIR